MRVPVNGFKSKIKDNETVNAHEDPTRAARAPLCSTYTSFPCSVVMNRDLIFCEHSLFILASHLLATPNFKLLIVSRGRPSTVIASLKVTHHDTF